MGRLQELARSAGFKAQVIGEPPLFDILFTDQPIKDYRDTLKADAATLKRFAGAPGALNVVPTGR
jgi:glutamate-1-semialdehyde 2,1-aminomutase